jgi:hypothetical protein
MNADQSPRADHADDAADADVDPVEAVAATADTTSGAGDATIDATADAADADQLLDDEPAAGATGAAAAAGGIAAILTGRPGRRFVAAASALALVNLALLAIVGAGWTVVLLHAATVALAAVGWKQMQDDDEAGEDWRLLAVAVAGLGPLGVLAVGGPAFLVRSVARGTRQPSWRSVPAWDDEARPFERAEANVEAALARRAAVVPFVDVLANGTTEQKQEMVSVIASNFQPSFARALRGAMNDTEPAVRMMAAAAAARIESGFLDRSMTLEARWADEPTDANRALDLARHYDAFAATDLLDESRADEARLRALEMYQLASRDLSRDIGIAQAILRLLLKLGREDEAIGLYQRRMDDGTAPPALASWYLECLYRRRRFGDLRHHAVALSRRVRDLDTLHPRSVDAMQLWAMGPPRSTALVPVDVLLDDVDVDADGPAAPVRTPRHQRPKFELPYFRPNYPG